MANNYEINYDDERFTEVEDQKQQALTELEQTYGGMIDSTDKYYQDQIDATKKWEETQSKLQQENTDFLIEQIEQQKEQANKDYQKEQSGAYVDWQKQSNQYGVNAEQMAATGMGGTGFSESSQVSMYNTYQQRLSSSREVYNQAVLNYNNNIKEAKLQNNVQLAEIAYLSFQQQLQLAFEGFQYQNQLILELQSQKQATDDRYYNRYQDVLNQMNQENALEENIRQYEKEYNFKMEQFKESIRQFDAEIARLKEKDAQENALAIQELELKKEQIRQEQENWQKEYDFTVSQYNEQKGSISGGSGGITGGNGGNGGITGNNNNNNNSVIDKNVKVDQSAQLAAARALGNSAQTLKKGDYYASDGRVQYMNNQKVSSTNMSTSILPKDLGFGSGGKIYSSGGKYYAWSSAANTYVDVTSEITFSNGYQPKYIGNEKVKSVGSIGVTIGSYKNLPTSQNVWMAGNKYYVWNGSTKQYEDVTKQYSKYITSYYTNRPY